MCGITGILGYPNGNSRVEDIKTMSDVLMHRGPDDADYYHDELISMGHRRLSINDIDGGRQPITNETGKIILICNGEIYNSPTLREKLISKGHTFKTKSDVEVIIHLYEEYGSKCVNHLQGMFAFALWDSANKKLMLARDHIGQKPLFYKADSDGFMFGSEVKAILAVQQGNRELDTEALWHYMSMRYMPDEHSLFKGVKKLQAGHYLLWEDGKVTLEHYWELSFTDKRKGSIQDATDELDQLLTDTIDSHLLSDVRVGGFLSGGWYKATGRI